MGLRANIEEVLRRIEAACLRANRDASSVRCVGVTKTVSIDRILEAHSLGVSTFGENYVQESLPKVAALPSAEWHFIGQLQSNKAKDVVAAGFSMVHSLDRPSLALELDKRCRNAGRTMSVLVEVNAAQEASKGGVAKEQAQAFAAFVAESCPSLRLEGLMTFPPPDADPRPHFSALRILRDEISTKTGLALPHLSMGISHDFEVAIEKGATLVRLGTVLFGARGQ